MMNQRSIIGLLAMLSMQTLPTFIEATEPRLRNSSSQQQAMVEGNEEEHDHDHDHPGPEEGCFKVDKSMSCEGGFQKEKGAGKMCKGHMKANFSAKTKSEDVVNDIATELLSQIVMDSSGFIPNTKDAFVPSKNDGGDDGGENAMETMLSWDNMSNDELLAMIMMNQNENENEGDITVEGGGTEGGDDDDNGEFFSKTVEFGGYIKAGWGCKVSIKMNKANGKFTKSADCGFKGGAGMGPGPKVSENGGDDGIDDYSFL